MDYIDDTLGLDDEDIIKRNRLSAEILVYLKQKEKLLSQKAKVKWALEGDVNSKFFHGWINRRLKKNEIDGLKVGDRWVESVREVKEAIFNNFHRALQL